MNATIPVFVFPNQIHYTPSASRAQTITLYNPYDYSVRFAVLCTRPQAFSLSATEGVIRARFCLDIVVRLLDEVITEETLLFTVRELTDGRIARNGDKRVTVTRSDAETERTPVDARNFAAVTQTSSDDRPASREIGSRGERSRGATQLNLMMAYAVAVVCLLVLLAPNDTDYAFGVHSTHKLVASYVLGIMTVVILRH